MTAPFSAIMIVGALVFVDVTAGTMDAGITRSPSGPVQPQRRAMTVNPASHWHWLHQTLTH